MRVKTNPIEWTIEGEIDISNEAMQCLGEIMLDDILRKRGEPQPEEQPESGQGGDDDGN